MKSTRQQWIYTILITISIILTPPIGFLGAFNGGNPEGQTPTELFLPADYAFIIWSVNYLGLIALGIWQGLPSQKDNPRARRAAPWLAVTAVGNIFWILFAGSVTTVPLTVIALLVMEISAWIAYFRLDIGNPDLPTSEKLLHVPLRVYLGWLAVATIANSASALNVLGWSGWGLSPVTWTLIMTVAGVIIAWEVGRRVNHDNIFRAVFVWAFIAIFVSQQATPAVAWAALAAALVIAGMIAFTLPRQRSLLQNAR